MIEKISKEENESREWEGKKIVTLRLKLTKDEANAILNAIPTWQGSDTKMTGMLENSILGTIY